MQRNNPPASYASWPEEIMKLFEPRLHFKAAASATSSPILAVITESPGTSLPCLLLIVQALLGVIICLIFGPMLFRILLELICQSEYNMSLMEADEIHPKHPAAKLFSGKFTTYLEGGWVVGGRIADAAMYIPRLNREMTAQRMMLASLTKLHEEIAATNKNSIDFLVWQADKTATKLKSIDSRLENVDLDKKNMALFACETQRLRNWADQVVKWGNSVDQRTILNNQYIHTVEMHVKDGFIWEQKKQKMAASEFADYKIATEKRIRGTEAVQTRLDNMNDLLVEIIDEEKETDDKRLESLADRMDRLVGDKVKMKETEKGVTEMQVNIDSLNENVNVTRPMCKAIDEQNAYYGAKIERLERTIEEMETRIADEICEHLNSMFDRTTEVLGLLGEKIDGIDMSMKSELEDNHDLCHNELKIIATKLARHEQKIEVGKMELEKQVTATQELAALNSKVDSDIAIFRDKCAAQDQLIHDHSMWDIMEQARFKTETRQFITWLSVAIDEFAEKTDHTMDDLESRIGKLTASTEELELGGFEQVEWTDAESDYETLVDGECKEAMLVGIVSSSKSEPESDLEAEFEKIEVD